ncbi:hypothetical protein HK100_000576, partial [Physocladia obscura]
MSLAYLFSDANCTVPISLSYKAGKCTASACAAVSGGSYSYACPNKTIADSASFQVYADAFFPIGTVYANEVIFNQIECSGGVGAFEADALGVCVFNGGISYRTSTTSIEQWSNSTTCSGAYNSNASLTSQCTSGILSNVEIVKIWTVGATTSTITLIKLAVIMHLAVILDPLQRSVPAFRWPPEILSYRVIVWAFGLGCGLNLFALVWAALLKWKPNNLMEPRTNNALIQPGPAKANNKTSEDATITATDTDTSLKMQLDGAGTVAAFTRSIAMQGTLAMGGMLKGLLKWWFRLPVNYVVNPYLVLNHSAAREGVGRMTYLRKALRKDGGLRAVAKNTFPLLIVNSLIGAFLFNTYAYASDAISAVYLDSNSIFGSKQDDSIYNNENGMEYRFSLTPFLAGAIAGASQSLLSTPIDNLQRTPHFSADSIIASRHSKAGIMSVFVESLKSLTDHAHSTIDALTHSTNPVATRNAANKMHHRSYSHTHIFRQRFTRYTRPLYQNFGLTCLKDSIGFALFFGLFENTRDAGKVLVKQAQDAFYVGVADDQCRGKHPIMKGVTITGPQALAIVAAGGFAGMGFQAVSFPIDRIQAEIQQSHDRMRRESAFSVFKRLGGIQGVYSGIGGQFGRVVPASAAALFVYELVNEYL